MTREEAKTYINENPQLFLSKASKSGYICPLCENGSGTDGTGIVYATTDKPNMKRGHFKCQKCGFYGDMVALAAAASGKPFPPKGAASPKEYADCFNAAYAYCGITIDEDPQSKKPVTEKKTEEEPNEPMRKADYSKFIAQCMVNNKPAIDYLNRRGITAETAEKFRIGYSEVYFPKEKKKLPAIIIPYNAESSYYSARSIDGKLFTKPKSEEAGTEPVFNLDCVKSDEDKPVFIVESSICAMSITQCGGNAIAINGIAYQKVVPALKAIPEAQNRTYVVSLDNDEAGTKASKELLRELKINGYYAYALNIADNCKDPNELLQADEAKLTANIRNAETEKQLYVMQSAAAKMSKFLDFVDQTSLEPFMSTGLKNVDDLLGGGIGSGLYIIGGGSSVGKTAFCCQIAEHIALKRDVMYISVEMSEFELMARSISRNTYRISMRECGKDTYALPQRTVMYRAYQSGLSKYRRDVLTQAQCMYADNTEHFYIVEAPMKITHEEVRQMVAHHQAMTGNAPVLFIDYLQLLRPMNDRVSDKQAMDDNITALKQLSRDYDIPVVAISSINRDSYSKNTGMAQFKESGSIEYSADCLLSLQLHLESNETEEKAKEHDPRNIELKMLKNRSCTATGTKPLIFTAQYMAFDNGEFSISQKQNTDIRNPNMRGA